MHPSEAIASKQVIETDQVVKMLRAMVLDQEPERPTRPGTPRLFWVLTGLMGLSATAGGYMLVAYLNGQRSFLPFLGW